MLSAAKLTPAQAAAALMSLLIPGTWLTLASSHASTQGLPGHVPALLGSCMSFQGLIYGMMMMSMLPDSTQQPGSMAAMAERRLPHCRFLARQAHQARPLRLPPSLQAHRPEVCHPTCTSPALLRPVLPV